MEPLIFTLILGLSLGHLAFLLNKTDFIVDYATLLGFRSLVLADDYEEWKNKEENAGWGYPVFIRGRFQGGGRFVQWASHMFGCPFCFVTFTGVVFSLIFAPYAILAGPAIASLVYLLEILIYKKNFEQS